MSEILRRRREKDITLSNYRDHKFPGTREEYEITLKNSTTLYVGNLSFHTREEQIYELFGKCGDIKKVILGLNRISKTPCGFCFIEYHSREEASNAIRYINGTRLDDRTVRTDWDSGFVEGRQFGRGKTGGQIRDEYRVEFDAGRGGYGKLVQKKNDPLSASEPEQAS